MFFLIPFSLFLVASIAIFLIVSRKFVYLKRLSPNILEDSSVVSGGFIQSFWGELLHWGSSFNFKEEGVKFLSESEKLLRKLRVVALRIDSFTHALIQRIRVTVQEHREKKAQERERAAVVPPIGQPVLDSANEPMVRVIQDDSIAIGYDLERSRQYLREEEQRLIFAIAKNPRDPQLYKELGEIYIGTREYDDARQSFAMALELDPEDTIIKKKLNRVLNILQTLPE